MHKQRVRLDIEGMSCGHCVKTVRSALEQVEGVDVLEVEIGSAIIVLDTDSADLQAVTTAVDDTGFQVVGASPK